MTSKTKLLPQAENGKKIAFKNFIVPSATLSVTNEPFCSDQGDELLSSWRQVGVKLACKKSRQQSDQTVTKSDAEATVVAACPGSRESFSRCRRTLHHLTFKHLIEACRGSQ